MVLNRFSLRQQLRAARRAVGDHERSLAVMSMVTNMSSSRYFRNSSRIAFYCAEDGEMDVQPLMHIAWKMNKQCYLPVLDHLTGQRLWFAPCSPDTRMILNRYGIPEPDVARRHRVRAKNLDMIMMPLVGFDESGNRMGMGGGYYDQTLRFMRTRQFYQRPYLCGVAFELQKLKQIKAQSWDVPMNSIVTEQALYQVSD